MRILIIDDESSGRDLLALTTQRTISAEIVTAQSGFEAIQTLKTDTHFQLIISDYQMINGTGADLFHYLQKKEMRIPFILCATEPQKENPDFKETDISGYVLKSEIPQELPKVLGSLAFLQKKVKSVDQKYVSVQMETLLRIGEMVCDVFVKLNEEKYVRVLKEGSSLTSDSVQRYRAKGIHSLFIDLNHCDKMIHTLVVSIASVSDLERTADVTTNLLKVLDKISDQQLKQELNHLNHHLKETRVANAEYEMSVKASELVHKAIQQSIQKIGASREVEQLIKATVKLAIETISSTPELSTYYSNLSQNPGEYINSHSVLLAHYSCLIADRMGWSSDLTRYKLSLASFMHDITLNQEKLAKVKSIADLSERGRFNEEEKNLVLNHASVAADLVKKMNRMPPDVDRLIEEHHCWAEGGGFPFQKSDNDVAPLTAVLIFAHELTDYIFENKGSPYAYQNFFVKNRRKFSQGIFKKIFMSVTGHSPEVRNLKTKAS
jgi:response regulator RpfG family c-di-GMP phosphodiesterase